MRYITAQECVVIPLGRQGETDAEVVQFPIAGWEETYGHGAFEVLHKRCMDEVPYPVTIEVTDEYVNWTVKAADVAYVGRGQAELIYVVNGTIAKSVIYGTSTLKSVDGGGEVPAPYESRIQDLIEASANISVEADRAETAATTAEDAADLVLGYKTDAEEAAQTAVSSAEQAAKDALDSEAWAVGQRNGVDVESDDVTFHNNSEFYANMAKQIAVNNGYASMWIDDDGVLYLARTQNIVDNLDFRLTADGELEAIIHG